MQGPEDQSAVRIVALQKIASACLLLVAIFARGADGAEPGDDPFKSAVAAWHLADLKDTSGKSDLKIVGAVEVGAKLQGTELQSALAGGNDGSVARIEGGYLDAGQGAGGVLNITGSSLTISVRLRSPSGNWGAPLFSKHGGHERLVYNLYSTESEISFELGTQGTQGLSRTTIPVAKIGPRDWHDIVCRYDGAKLQMFADGVLVDEAFAKGPLREGNPVPCLIGGESYGDRIKSGWKGEIDHVALWNRALSDTEVVRLAGGAERVAALKTLYAKDPAPLSPPADLYQEKLRPQFHFTARQWTLRKLNPGMREEGWLNDPNGLIHLDGEYHLFAQRWNKCWIHAVSPDLVHWTELQPAFWEDKRFGTGVQSGGAVLDKDNSSGLSPDPKSPPLVAFWSGNDNRSQCISYSLDKGRTWTKYAKNPVLDHPERDPKVFWYEPGKRWIMVLYGAHSYNLFTSTNLLDWTQQKDSIPDCFECPDLFQLPLDGDRTKQKWVLVRGNGKYSVGDFDGSKFVPETGQLPCDMGPNFYATQSWGDIAGQEGRRVQIAWMRDGKYPDMPFNQQMTFPCDLSLHMLAGSLRVFRKPVREIELLHGKENAWKNLAIKPGAAKPLDVAGDLFHILAEVEMAKGSSLTFFIRGTPVTLTDHSLACNCDPAPLPGGLRTVEILVDRTSIESFANDGEVSISTCFLPTNDAIKVECTQGSATIRSLHVFELDSSWKGTAKP
jgi:fructan beta-fructosidase